MSFPIYIYIYIYVKFCYILRILLPVSTPPCSDCTLLQPGASRCPLANPVLFLTAASWWRSCHHVWYSASPLAAYPSTWVPSWSCQSVWIWSLPSLEQPSSPLAHLVGSSAPSHTHQSRDVGGHQRGQDYYRSCPCRRDDLCPPVLPTVLPLLRGSSRQLMCRVSHPFLQVCCIQTHTRIMQGVL